MKKKLLRWLSLSLCCTVVQAQNPAGSPVDMHGLLKTKGNKIVDRADTAVSLAGNSMFWSQWSGDLYNANVVKWLKDDWNSNIIRAAMGVDETDGYITNPEVEKKKVTDIVDACIAQGLYVIIDWHSHKAENYKTQSIAFFKEMATKYGKYPNVIYEVYNEPLDNVTWSAVIKPYAVDVIAEIRKIDPDNLVLVGTQSWSQEVVDAANDPIYDNNVAYVLHFYVGSHGKWLRDKAQSAIDKGAPLFVSEWGLWGSDDDLGNWMNFAKANKLSWCNWAVCTKDEPSSVLKPSASANGNWPLTDLTDIGNKVRNYMWGWNPKVRPCTLLTAPFAANKIPGKIEAENFDLGCSGNAYYDMESNNFAGKYRNEGVDIEACTDVNVGFNVGYLEAGEWMSYTLDATAAGLYQISIRAAAMKAGGSISVLVNDNLMISSKAIPGTGDWQAWQDVPLGDVIVPQSGKVVLKLKVESGGFNINNFTLSSVVTGTVDQQVEAVVLVSQNISSGNFQVQSPMTISSYDLHTATGQALTSSKAVNAQTFEFGQNLTKGLYLLTLYHADGTSSTHRLMKE